MRKIIYFIYENKIRIIAVILLSIFFVFLLFPIMMNLEFIKNFLSRAEKESFIAITALVLLFITCSWSRVHNLWRRYKNTYKLTNPVFTYFDGVVLFIAFSSLLISLFQLKSIPTLSSEFKVFAIVNIICIISWFLSSYYWKEKRDKEERESSNIDTHLLSDEPIQFIEQDLLGRKKFIEDLYQEIINLPFTDSFVFGLYGRWGEGKTSVINLLRNRLKENEKILFVNFNPWHFRDEEAILTAFYKHMEQAIDQQFIFPDLKKTFTRYRKLISTGLSLTGIKLDFSHMNGSLEETKQRIESYIMQTKRKIIIFIDDIDRLQPKEVLLIFELVRLNSKFKNTIFLLSFDPVVIQNYLREYLNTGPEFLEKIVQKPISLPAIEQGNIDRFLGFHIEKFFDEMEIPQKDKEKFNEDFGSIYRMQISKLFKTLRHAKRFLNGLRSTLPPIKNEVNLYDFFILEVIRIFYPKVFDDIWANPWFYVPSDWSDTIYLQSPFNVLLDADKKYHYIKEHIENLIKNEREKDVLRKLLEEIFFVEVKNALSQGRTDYTYAARTYRVEKRITHPESFKKYFMLKVPPLEISDEFIETILDLWHSMRENERENIFEKTIFKLQKDDKLLEFFRKLIVFRDRIERKIVPNIVKVIYKNAGKFSKEGTEDLWNSEYDQSMILMLLLINDKIDKPLINNILKEVVIETPDFPFAVRIILLCKRDRGFYNIYESIKIEELQNKVAERLKKYFIEENRDIFEELPEKRDWIFVLYQWATNWMTFTEHNNKIVNNYVFSLIKDDIKKFIKFLSSQRQRTDLGSWIFDLKELEQIWNLAELQKLAEKFKDDTSLSKEEKGPIEIFLKLCAEWNVKKEEKNQ